MFKSKNTGLKFTIIERFDSRSSIDVVLMISVVQAYGDCDCSTWYANEGGHPRGGADVDQGEGDAERAGEDGEECSALYPSGDRRVEGATVSRRQMPTGE